MERMPGDALEQARMKAMNLDILKSTNPWMFERPEIAQQLATSGLSPDQLATQGAEIFAMQNMDAFAQTLQGMSAVAQRSAFDSLTQPQRQALRTLGYQPPENSDGAFLGGALGPIGEGVGMAWSGVSTVGGAVLGPTLNALEYIGDQPAHLYRTIRTMDSEYQWLALGGALAAGAFLAPAALGAAAGLGLGTVGTAGIAGMTMLGGATATAAIFGRGQWWEAFQATADGERVFSMDSQRRARALLVGDQYMSLAREVAMELGEDIDVWDLATEIAGERGAGSMTQMTRAIERLARDMAEPNTPEYTAAFNALNTLTTQEPFRQAVDALQGGKISFGRDIANLAQLDRGDKLYNLVSGSIDAAWLWGMDPFLGVGAVNRANKARKYGLAENMSFGQQFEYIRNLSNNNTKIRAVHEQIAMAMRMGRPDLMPKASRGQFLDLLEYSRQAGLVDEGGRVADFQRADFLDWIATGAGMKSILSGQGTVRGMERIVLSTVSESRGWGRMVAEGKGLVDALDDANLEKRIARIARKHGVDVDFDAARASRQLEQPLNEGGLITIDSIDERAAGGIGSAIGNAVTWVPGTKTLGSFLGSISAMAPSSAAISIVGDGSEESIRRWIDSMGRTFGLPKAMREEWLTAVAVQGNSSQRMNVMQSYLDSLMTASGLRATDEGAVLADRFLSLHRHAYALGGSDELVVNGRHLTRGWLPEAHSATHLLMPNLTELQKLVRRQDMFGQILGITDSNLVESGMNRVWKPAILLRLGFIPRAAGEEALAWFARATSGGILQEIGARELSSYKAYHDARRAIDEGKTLTGIGAEAAKWDLPPMARPLHWMLARRGFKTPVESTIDSFRDSLADFLETGWMAGDNAFESVIRMQGGERQMTERLLSPGQQFIRKIDPKYRPLLLGKEHSWRHLAIGGIDPALKEAADAWVLRHADAVMKGTSAMSHSLFQTEVIRPDRQMQIVADPNSRSGVTAEEILTLKGQRQRVYKQDPAFAAAAHHRISEPLWDAVMGPALRRKYTHHFPETFKTLTPPVARDAIMGAKSIKTFTGRHLASGFLTPRDDVWRASAVAIEDYLPEVSQVVKGMSHSGDPITLDRLQMALLDVRNDLQAAKDQHRAGVVEALIEEIEGFRPFIEAVETLPQQERGWLVGATAQELYAKTDFYETSTLNAWAEGATETVAKRPERVFYRGVKDDSTFTINPDGSLTLHPQHNGDWNTDTVSLSMFPDQSLGYAVSPGAYNSGATVSSGAMLELDGDYILQLHGTDWDSVSGAPRSYKTDMFDQHGDGVHLVGWEPGTVRDERALTQEDMGEVALVRPPRKSPLDDQIAQLEDDISQRLSDIAVATGDEAEQLRSDLMPLQEQLRELTHQRAITPLPSSEDYTIPAGKWRFQTHDEMEAITKQIQEGMETRWEWLANVKYRTEGGKNIEQIQRDVVAKFRTFDLEEGPFGGYEPLTEQIDEFAAYLRALPEDERDVLQQMVGLQYRFDGTATDESRYNEMSRQLLTNADQHFESIEKALALRGTGEFMTTGAAWTPFTTSDDELWRTLNHELEAQMMRGDNGEWMRQSQRSSMSGDVNIADQVPDGMNRVFLPTVGNEPEVIRAMDRVYAAGLNPEIDADHLREFIEAVVDDLLSQGYARRMHTDFIKGLQDGPVRNSLAQAVKQFVTEGRNRHLLDGSGMTLPMHGAGYSDPRIAQWIGDVLTGGPMPNPVQNLGYVDIPRAINRKEAGVRYVSDYGPAGAAYEFDDIIDANIRHIDSDQMTQMPDGSYAPGAAWTRGIQDHANVATDILRQVHTGGQQERYKLREEMVGQVFRQDAPGQRVAVGADEILNGPTELIDEAGNPIDWTDPRLFEKMLAGESDQQLYWEVLGPLLADLAAEQNGFAKLTPREMTALRQQPQYQISENTAQAVQMTHSRIDDVQHVMSRLPDASITEVPKPVKTGVFQKGVRWGFDNVIGPALNSLVRRPMSFHYFAAAHKQNMQYMRWFIDEDLHASVSKVFGGEIKLLNELSTVTPSIAHDVKLVDHKWYGNADEMDDDLIRRWIGSHAGSQREWEGVADEAAAAARAEHKPDVADAWERLRALDQGPFRTAGVNIGETDVERLILAYRQGVPTNVRADGPKAVNSYIKSNNLGLPHVDDARLNTIDAAIKNWDHIYEMVEETATMRALENVIPFLDDHTERSQFAVAARNFLPFWYAEELFLKRWARTLQISPEALRKGQLLYMGMKSAGTIRTDTNGQDWVVYPGSGMLTSFISGITPWKTVDVGTLFQASTDSLLPGLNAQMGAPALSPLAAMPVDYLTQTFPEMVTARKAMLGEVGSVTGLGRHPIESAMRQLVPSSAQRLWRAAFSDENSAVAYANAVSYAMAAQLAENPNLLQNASPEELQDFLDRARSHARVIMFAQAIAGFVAPGAPVAVNTGADAGTFGWLTGIGVENPDQLISDTYRRYVKGSGIDEGTRRFLQDFPYADLQDVVNPLAYTVSTTSSVSGAPLPAARVGMAWYEQNKGWVDSQSHAGAWFIPHDDADEEFDFYSYSQQASYELRKRNAPEDFLKSMIYRTSAGEYFGMQEQYETLKGEVPSENRAAHQYLDAEWDSWQTAFLGSNPVFANELKGGEAKQRRQTTIEQLRYAVGDSQAPESPHREAIEELSKAFDRYVVIKKQLSMSRSQRHIRGTNALKADFENWVGQWILRNPSLERLWSSVYKPEANL